MKKINLIIAFLIVINLFGCNKQDNIEYVGQKLKINIEGSVEESIIDESDQFLGDGLKIVKII